MSDVRLKKMYIFCSWFLAQCFKNPSNSLGDNCTFNIWSLTPIPDTGLMKSSNFLDNKSVFYSNEVTPNEVSYWMETGGQKYQAMIACVHACLVALSCLTLCDPVHCSPPVSSALGILQARILEWVARPSSRASSWPRDWTHISCIASRFFTCWAIGVSQAMIRSLEFLTLPTHSLEKGGGLKMELMIYYAYVMKLP